MSIEKGFQENICNVIEEQWSLAEFEAWLYKQDDLIERLDEPIIFELYTFTYNQRGAYYIFRDTFLAYIDADDFLLWKVITNLRDLIESRPSFFRILNDFERIGRERNFTALQLFSSYYWMLDAPKLYGETIKTIKVSVKEDAQIVLAFLLKEQQKNLGLIPLGFDIPYKDYSSMIKKP